MWYNQYTISNGPATVEAMTGILDVMTYKQLYDVINRGCDVINSAYGVQYALAVISYIHRV